MTMPGATIRRVDGNLGLARASADKLLVIGPSSLGTPNVIETASQPKSLSDALGIGRAVTTGCHILDVAGGTVDVMTCTASVAASNGSVTQSGAGPVVTVAGSALEAFTAIVRVNQDGQRGAGRFDFSLDGETFGAVRTIPANGVFAIPNSGLTVTFAAISAITRSGGTAGPLPTLSGASPTLDGDFIIEITTGGVVGTAVFKWSSDGGATYTTGVSTAASVLLTATGVTVAFTAGTYILAEKYAFTTGFNEGTTYSFTATPATFNSADLDAVIAALLLLNTRWKSVVWAGRPASAAAAAVIAETIAGHMDSLADQARDSTALIDLGGDPSSSMAAIHTAFDAVESVHLAGCYSDVQLQVANPIEGWRRPWLPTLTRAAGEVAAFTRGTNIGWVGEGSAPTGGLLDKVSGVDFDENKEGEQLSNHRVITTRTFDGDSPGKFYFTNGLVMSPIGSDFKYLHWKLAFDLLCQTVNDSVRKYINATVPVLADGSGKIQPVKAEQIDKGVNTAISLATLEPVTEQGVGYFSAAAFAVDRTTDVLRSSQLTGSFRAVPFGNTEQVVLTGGLTTDLSSVQAA